jgi:hypothetical protein
VLCIPAWHKHITSCILSCHAARHPTTKACTADILLPVCCVSLQVELLPPLPLQVPLAGTGSLSLLLLPPLQPRPVAAACRVHRAPHSGVAQLPLLPLPVVVSVNRWPHTCCTVHTCKEQAQLQPHSVLSCSPPPYNQGHACIADILLHVCCASLQVELLPPLLLLVVAISGSRLLPPPLQPLRVAGLVQALPPLLRQVAAACRVLRPPASGVAPLPLPPLRLPVAGLVQALPPPLLWQVAAACRVLRPPASGVARPPLPPLPVVVSARMGCADWAACRCCVVLFQHFSFCKGVAHTHTCSSAMLFIACCWWHGKRVVSPRPDL